MTYAEFKIIIAEFGGWIALMLGVYLIYMGGAEGNEALSFRGIFITLMGMIILVLNTVVFKLMNTLDK